MKIAYWATSSLEPEYEAVSKEIFLLARHFEKSWIFSISPHLSARFSWRDRCVGTSVRAYPLLRAIVPGLERAFDVSHVYGDATPWLFHKSLRCRPIVHTVTECGDSPVTAFLQRCSAIVVQTAATRDQILDLGLPPSRVRLWYPGVDLDVFRPRPRERDPAHPISVLFATAPRTVEEMGPRGVDLLLATAALARTDLEITMLYRPWRTGYTSLEATRSKVRDSALDNVALSNGIVADIHEAYPEHDFTVIPYTTPQGGKECPTSALESLACGVPILVSSMCRFSEFVARHRCGVVFEPTPDALLAAARTAASRRDELARNARRAAREHLDLRVLLNGYDQLYREAAEGASAEGAGGHGTGT